MVYTIYIYKEHAADRVYVISQRITQALQQHETAFYTENMSLQTKLVSPHC